MNRINILGIIICKFSSIMLFTNNKPYYGAIMLLITLICIIISFDTITRTREFKH